MNIVLDTTSLNTLAKGFAQFPEIARQEMHGFMRAATGFLQGEVIERTPAAEGTLRDSIHPFIEEIPGGMIGVIGTSLSYAAPVELGTKPHMPPIAPLEQWVRTKLGIGGKQGTAVARSIQWKIYHHGTKGAFMFTNALRDNKAEIERQFASMVQRLTDRLAGAAK